MGPRTPRKKIVCGSLPGIGIELLPELPQDVEKQFRKANKELQAALKLSQKRGKQSDVED